jgi:alpha-L-rhamnosidase
VGCDKFVIAPRVPGTADASRAPLEWVRASYRSPRGDVRISWRISHEADAFAHVHHFLDAEVMVPPNTEAEVILPTSDATRVQEGDVPAAKAMGVRSVTSSVSGARIQVGSGSYRFRSPLAGNASVF